MDTLSVGQIRPFEHALYGKLETTYSSLLEQIKAEKKLTEEIENKIKEVIELTVHEVVVS